MSTDGRDPAAPKPGDTVSILLHSDGHVRTSVVAGDGSYTGRGAVEKGRADIVYVGSPPPLRAAQKLASDSAVDPALALEKLRKYPDHATYLLHSVVDDAVSALFTAGYRLVSDDPATVERVAKAMANADGYDAWTSMPAGKRDRHLIQARAAIAALKGENQ